MLWNSIATYCLSHPCADEVTFEHLETQPSRSPGNFLFKCYRNLKPVYLLPFFFFLLSPSLHQAHDWPTFAAVLNLLLIIAITVPWSLAWPPGCWLFFLMLLLARLHGPSASMRPANEPGTGLAVLWTSCRSGRACFQDSPVVARSYSITQTGEAWTAWLCVGSSRALWGATMSL